MKVIKVQTVAKQHLLVQSVMGEECEARMNGLKAIYLLAFLCLQGGPRPGWGEEEGLAPPPLHLLVQLTGRCKNPIPQPL